MAFQYPATIPGVSVANFLRMAVNAGRDEPIKVKEFGAMLKGHMDLLKIDRNFTSRYLNEGFSGGEKKRAEILQLAMLQPEFAVLDETDSGLDIDALRIVSEGVNAMRGDERGFLIITHYTRILKYVKPDFVHILINGKIVREGGSELADELEDRATSSCARRWREWRLASWRTAVAPRSRSTSRRRCPPGAASGFWTTTAARARPRRARAEALRLARTPHRRDHLGDEEHAALIVQQGRERRALRRRPTTRSRDAARAGGRGAPGARRGALRQAPADDEGKFAAAPPPSGPAACSCTCPTASDREADPGRLADRRARHRQWAHTLVVVGEHAEVQVREYFLAPDFEGQALHAGAFELYAQPGRQVDLAHYQDWGRGDVHDLSTRGWRSGATRA
jgi:hypothetical protein